MSMTSDAKRQLANTIRSLRATLLDDLHGETDRVYRLAIKVSEAGLRQALFVKRQRLEAWLDEQVRAEAVRGTRQRTRDDFRREVEKQAAYTLLNRLVFLRLLEAFKQRSPEIVTGGWNSLGYRNFREIAPALVRNDETEGYAQLLTLVFDDLAIDLPGLYGPAGMADLIPIPAKSLRAIVDAFDDMELASCWTDDMTLGWVYQYWNDPEREALDAKINAGGKVEPFEIASKTQMFTERYMVDWLLQNSLGPTWLAICRKHGWVSEVEADGTLDRLEQWRVAWLAKRNAGEVALTELMPLESAAERRWAYYVPQPLPDDAVEHALRSVRDLKILDPAVGSGHFLVVAFDLLFALYQEEARHRDEVGNDRWSDRAIVEQILGFNLHGIDLDPRAVQIAAAALWLKGRLTCPAARPEHLNLVASNLRLASLPDNDLALVELRRTVEAETGIPGTLMNEIVHALRGADYLGSLLKVDAAVEDAIARHEAQLQATGDTTQKRLFDDGAPTQQGLAFPKNQIKASVLERLEEFLSRHTSGDDLGLRLRGEQLTAGVRFLRFVREGTYDLVVGNPPYQGVGKVHGLKPYLKLYPAGRTDLYAGFFLRAPELLRHAGLTAMISLSNWMFQSNYIDFRHALKGHRLTTIADLGKAAFTTGGTLIATSCTVLRKGCESKIVSRAIQPNSADEIVRDDDQPRRTEVGLLLQRRRFDFDATAFVAIDGEPIVYWWSPKRLVQYAETPKMAEKFPARATEGLYSNTRFVRWYFEVPFFASAQWAARNNGDCGWVPFTNGSNGATWFEPLRLVADWDQHGIKPKLYKTVKTGSDAYSFANERFFFLEGGVAFAGIGTHFTSRIHRYPGVFGNMGRSVFSTDPIQTVCLMNSKFAHDTMSSLNPGHHFEVGDVNRLPLIMIPGSDAIFETVNQAFSEHESRREPSVEFKQPGPSRWRHAQEWAQAAVDRPEGAPLPSYEPEYDPEPATDHLSFAIGVVLGRFRANAEGVLDPAQADRAHTLPGGILFLDETLDANDHRDGLGHRAAQPLIEAWKQYGAEIAPRSNLREFLREKFFADVHRQMYENRPIHWPLSSEKKTFVAWVNIHRWTDSTLRMLLADHLQPTLTRLEGELVDLRIARDGADRGPAKEAEKRFGEVQKARDELAVFIKLVEQCAEKGPPPTDAACPPREADACYVPDLDDGVMINSAALWPLLTPQWKDPKKWWKELATAKGKKDYDWSHLAMRYWPTRVDAKCQQDPSLGVAHGCFWKYHPARAWAWELRLQDEIGPDFRIQETPYRDDGGDVAHRAAFLRDQADQALAAIEKEALRRRRKQKCPQATLSLLESGLWSAVPEEIWKLELRVSEKQGTEFRLLAPDEPAARADFESDHPELVQARNDLLASLAPDPELFADEEGEEEGDLADKDESGEIENEEADE